MHAAFNQLQLVFQAPEGTPQADEREVLVTLIEAYEQKHYPVSLADPIQAIKFRMEPQNLTPKDPERPRKTSNLTLAPADVCQRYSTADGA